MAKEPHGKGTVNNRHLVARCPFCARPVWMKRMVALLNIDTMAARNLVLDEVAFIAETINGKRGWKPASALRSLDELAAHAGPNAVAQLRKLARITLERMWRFGLLTRDDLEIVAGERSVVNTRKNASRAQLSEDELADALAQRTRPIREATRGPYRFASRQAHDIGASNG